MKFAHFFITRPIFATVISVVIVLLGGIAYFTLPVAQYPEIAPPTIVVSAQYPGASAQVVADTVATPIEQQVNGVENMLYMQSQSTADGTMSLTITFKSGTNLDTAQVLVQNRVTLAEPTLPATVRVLGTTVNKQSPNIMMVINLIATDKSIDNLYLSNYAVLQLQDPLKRVSGVGDINIFGARNYSMRLWLDPNRMFSRGLAVGDIIAAVQAQNIQVAAGSLGAPPAPPGTAEQILVNAKGRLTTPGEFERIIVKRGERGQLVRLGDVAKVELAAQDYLVDSYLDDSPSAGIGIYQLPGANALSTAAALKAEMARLAKSFPPGVTYKIAYDPTTFISQSIEAVFHTLLEAVVLVVVVVLVFLQTWRATIIPLLAVPVSLIGTLAAMSAMGFSLNNLSLFGLVLAIGIVVDDAIVVVENVERWIERGLEPHEATRKAMDEVSGAVVAIAIVLSAVFIPTALISGITGQFYRQFALTISVATIISAFNSLTLSPALAALLLKPRDTKKDWLTRGLDVVAGWFFRLFNKGFEATTNTYTWLVKRVIRFAGVALLIYAGLLVLTVYGFKTIPTGFIPYQDQGYIIAAVQLPDAASLERTNAVRQRLSAIARKIPGVANTVEISGFSALDGTTRSNALAIFVVLTPFAERMSHPEQGSLAVVGALQAQANVIQEARIIVVPPPAVSGMGNVGGFQLMVQDKGAAGSVALQAATEELIAAGNAQPGLTNLFTSLSSDVPQIFLNIDRDKVEALDVPVTAVFDALQGYLGGIYVNDFNFLGRTYQVKLQAGENFRVHADQIRNLYVRSNVNAMVPLGTVTDVVEINGPDKITHFNLFPAGDVSGATKPGFSSGDAITTMNRLAAEKLPEQFGFAWTGLSFQEILAGNTALYIFPLCVLFVFLALAALYESWALPMAIILIVPMCIFSALVGVSLRGLDNDIFTQIAFVVLVGLACKNAILIVEFAKQQSDEGKNRREAALEAARLRLRPILMTSFAFILGVVPLLIAKGAGAEMRQALGTAVFSGMLGVTFFGVFLTPAFYVIIMWMTGKGGGRGASS